MNCILLLYNEYVKIINPQQYIYLINLGWLRKHANKDEISQCAKILRLSVSGLNSLDINIANNANKNTKS